MTQSAIDEERDAMWGAVGARLRAPDHVLTLVGLAETFLSRHLQLRLSGLGPLAQDPGLIGRIRGAFGVLLADAASPEVVAGRPCPWSPPCAFEALFRKQGRMTPGLDFPAPWLLAVEPARRADLFVTLTIMGCAVEWMPAAAEILTLALTHHVDWRGATGLFCPQPVIEGRRLIDPGCPALPDPPPRAIELDVLTPLVTTGVGARRDPAAAFTSLGHRLEGLARWHDATLEGTDWRGLSQALRRLAFTWIEPERVAWTRGSARQNRRIPMEGVVGRLLIEGDLDDLALTTPLFVLGERTHVGADVAFGCGRYRMM